jgi:collagenase-like PrtC family protease
VSLNASAMLGELIAAGVHAFKIEGRQRSKAYVKKVVAAFRAAVDAIAEGREPELADLVALTEGQKQTEGALKTKRWR